MLEDVREFNLRKTNRLQAVLMKFDDIEDIAKSYNIKPSMKLIKDAKKILSSNIAKKPMNNNDSTISVLSFKISNKEKRNEILEELQEKYIEAGEYIVERELEEEKDNMTREYLEESINLIDTDTAIEYKKCIKSLNNLSKMIKVNKLNSKAFEIAKDLKACLNYEDKIDKIQNAKVGV